MTLIRRLAVPAVFVACSLAWSLVMFGLGRLSVGRKYERSFVEFTGPGSTMIGGPAKGKSMVSCEADGTVYLQNVSVEPLSK